PRSRPRSAPPRSAGTHPPPPRAPPRRAAGGVSTRLDEGRPGFCRAGPSAGGLGAISGPPASIDATPLGAVVVNEDLVVEAVDLDGDRGHVGREGEERRRPFHR